MLPVPKDEAPATNTAGTIGSNEIGAQTVNPIADRLSSHVKSCFESANTHRQSSGITDRILKSRRLKSGKYDDAKLQKIRERGGTELFFNITETKCESFEAWMEDAFAPSGERAWDASPTPIPDLSNDETRAVSNAVVQQFSGVEQVNPEAIKQYAGDMYDAALRNKFDDAKKKCDRMVTKMEDQTMEGGFNDALGYFFSDLGTYPSAILKGPVFERRNKIGWKNGKIEKTEDVAPRWYCVDPMRFYPGPNARNTNESYVCEVIDFDRSSLSEMRGIEGWSVSSIEKILTNYGSGSASNYSEQLPGESEMGVLEHKDTTLNSGLPDSTIRAIEFWGKVQGKDLLEWGMGAEEIKDQFKFYEVTCILIGNDVVRAVMNPDPLGRRPYYVTSFLKNKNSLWGLKSIPEKMEDCQDGVNGAQRNMMNNLAIASGPQVSVDIDAIPASQVPTVNQIFPWKIWTFRGSKTAHREPIGFFQPESHAGELMGVSDFFEKKADDRTLIPRYVYGNDNMTGAGSTASGLSMLMTAANRGIKRIIKNVDRDVLRPAIERLYTWNMLYLEDDSLKGDALVVPRGALAMLVKEQTQARRNEFLSATNNPTDLQIIGIENRANLLREIARGLDLPVEKVVPSEAELKQRVQAMEAQQRQISQQIPADQQNVEAM